MRARRSLLRLGVAAIALLGVAGCGGDSDDNGDDGAARNGSGGSGTLVYGFAGGGLTSLDPNRTTSGTEKPLASLLYDGLTTRAPDGSTQPGLAESWTTSDDGRTWTFELRAGVTYHDGRPFTADDAVANIERVLDPEVGSQALKRVADVKKATAKDDQTLVVKLKKPNALFPDGLTDLRMSDVETIDQINKTANGTGPYKLDGFVPDDRVTLKRNPDYWGEPGGLGTIEIVRAADATSAVTSLRTGELSVLWGVPPSDAKSLEGSGSIKFIEPERFSGTVTWELDTTSPPFDDPRARQGLAHAVNRDAFLEAAFQGVGETSPANSPISASSPAYASGLTPYEYDLDKAKALFEQAGVKELTFWTTAGRNPQWVTMAEILQQDLEKIGVELKIQQKEVSAWLEKFFPAGQKYPGTIIANYLSLPPVPAYDLQFFVSGSCECNWNNAEYDELLATALETQDEAQRFEQLEQLQAMVAEEVPVVIPLHSATIVAAQSGVEGVWVESEGTPHLEGATIGS